MNRTTSLEDTRLMQFCSGNYSGMDLTAAFADEISAFSSPWDWIYDRAAKADFSGLLPGDYIPFTTSDGEIFEAQIAGMDTYFNTTDQEPGIGHHIDFITRTCCKEVIPWNLTKTNNGTEENPNPWRASHLCHELNTRVFDSLPEDLKKHIIPKRMMIEKRYSPDGLLSSSDGWQWNEVGRLWVPNEHEVYGAVVWGSKGFSCPQAVQYPLFACSWKNRLKHFGTSDKDRCYWWLMNPFDGDTDRVCLTAIHGNASRNFCDIEKAHAPICFRIGDMENKAK